METSKSLAILASFATIKTLNDENKYSSTYQVLAEFIKAIIQAERLYSFSAAEMKGKLLSVYGFDIPEAVVKSALKKIDSIERKNASYRVNRELLKADDSFNEINKKAETAHLKIVEDLKSYISSRDPKTELNDKELTREFIAMIIDDQNGRGGRYSDYISEFIVLNEHDEHIKETLNTIRGGSLLYIGLCYNINEVGSITKPLTLYLDTEVLFYLYGYNGEIYQQLALDLIKQVEDANRGDKEDKIRLRYFGEVKEEIETFFSTAEAIVDGKMPINENIAMQNIINGCETRSDVTIKKADFFHTLKTRYKIIEDERSGKYYDSSLDIYNLEQVDITDERLQEAWRFVSHINKLRKGQLFGNILESEHIVVTNTYTIVDVSNQYSKNLEEKNRCEYVSDYAVTVEKITNQLWYKLGKGFGNNSLPINVNAVLKARIVLASSITQNVERVYNETSELYKNGSITEDELAARIITLKRKPRYPEDIEGDDLEDTMNFSSEFITRYEERVRTNEAELIEKNAEIESLRKQRDLEREQMSSVVSQKDEVIQQKDAEKEALERELAKAQEENRKNAEEKAYAQQKKEKRRKIWKKVICLSAKLILFALLLFIIQWLDGKYGFLSSYWAKAIEIIGIIVFLGTTAIKEFKSFKEL